MIYLLSASFYLILFYFIGIIFSFKAKKRLLLEEIFVNSAYGLCFVVSFLFIFNHIFPLKNILTPVTYVFIIILGVIITINKKPIISTYSIVTVIFYYLLTIYIFQTDIIFKTSVSFGWNEDFFFHERIMRIINNYSQVYRGPFPSGYIDTVANMLNRIHYPIGSHILTVFFNNFDRLFHSIIAAASNTKIFYSYALLIFFSLMRKTKFSSWKSFLVGTGIYSIPLMQSIVANDFIGQIPSFFIVTLLVWKFLNKEFNYTFVIIVFALLVTYYFMIIPFIPAFIIFGIVKLRKRKFFHLGLLGILTAYMFYYYLPLAKHIEGDIIPGGLTQRFTWTDISGIGYIYSGITAQNRLRFIFVPLTFIMLGIMLAMTITKWIKKDNKIKHIINNPYIYTFIPVIFLTIVSYFFLKPYLFYKLLPPLYIILGFVVLYGYRNLSFPLKSAFLISWSVLLLLNVYHVRLYYYNPTRTTNSQFPNTERFKTIDTQISPPSAIIVDNIYFNNLLSLKHNDIGIYTRSAYSNFLPDILINSVDMDSQYYLPDYRLDLLNNIFISSELNGSSPPISSFLFNRKTENGIDIYTKKNKPFRRVFADNKPILALDFSEIRSKIPRNSGATMIVVWQNKDQAVDAMIPIDELQKYFENKYPLFVYSIYASVTESEVQELIIAQNDYLTTMKNILEGDARKTSYMIDIGLYADSFFIRNFQPIRYWESQRGWSKLIKNGSYVNVPAIISIPKAVTFSIGTAIPQEVLLVSKNCSSETIKVNLNANEFKDVDITIPPDCLKKNYIFEIVGLDLGKNNAIIDKFTVWLDKNPE